MKTSTGYLNMRRIVFLTFLFGIFILGLVNAIGTETLITTLTKDSSQVEGDISGDLIVWKGEGSCARDLPLCCSDGKSVHLFIYNISSGNETILCDPSSPLEPRKPSLSGTILVWTEGDSSNYTIKAYDLDSSELGVVATQIEGKDMETPQPRISGEDIVWQAFNSTTSTYEIYRSQYNIPTSTLVAFNISSTYPPEPDISDNLIVWQEFQGADLDDESATFGIYKNNITTTVLLATLSNAIYATYPPSPRISGDTVVWQAHNIDSSWFDITRWDPVIGPEVIASTIDEWIEPHVVIDEGNIVWADWGNPNSNYPDLFLYDSVNFYQLTTNESIQQEPEISGDRIVWVDSRNGDYDIYLNSLLIEDTCPVADFSAEIDCSISPLSVKLTDQTSNLPLFWHWNFGDELSSLEQHVNHTYSDQGVYDLRLTVSNAACRDAVQKTVNVGNPPLVGFTADPSSGYAPLTVNFTDESIGCVDTWSWDFGDESISDEQNPPHIFNNRGMFQVNLTASNSIGEGNASTFIYVFNRTGEIISCSFDGIEIETTGQAQLMSLNTSLIPAYLYNETHLWFEPPSGYGIGDINVVSDGIGFTETDGIISGDIRYVLLRSNPIPLEGFHNDTGVNASVSYVLNLTSYPENCFIEAFAWEGGIPQDIQTIDVIASQNNYGGVWGAAYEVQFSPSNITIPYTANITMSINSSWVQSHGGKSAIRLIRITSDQVILLPTTFQFNDTMENLDYFSAYSPMGLSKFVFTSLFKSGNPLQLVVLTAQQWFGGDGGGDGDGGVTIITATPRRVPSPSTIIPETVPTPEPTATQETVEQATIEVPIPTPTLPVIESAPSPVPTTTTPLPPYISIIALVAMAGVLWLVKRRK